MILTTVHGYNFFDVSSCLQKSIRRGDAKLAGYMALELWSSGYANYVWKRLFTISAEDCWGIITQEIESLWQGYRLVNDKTEPKGRIFISKAVLVLCQAKKCRDADHLSNFVYDKKNGITDKLIEEEFKDLPQYVKLPDYIYDVHTMRGKKMGKTKEEFFKEEYKALKNRQPGLFDNIIEELPDSVEQSKKHLIESKEINKECQSSKMMEIVKINSLFNKFFIDKEYELQEIIYFLNNKNLNIERHDDLFYFEYEKNGTTFKVDYEFITPKLVKLKNINKM